MGAARQRRDGKVQLLLDPNQEGQPDGGPRLQISSQEVRRQEQLVPTSDPTAANVNSLAKVKQEKEGQPKFREGCPTPAEQQSAVGKSSCEVGRDKAV